MRRNLSLRSWSLNPSSGQGKSLTKTQNIQTEPLFIFQTTHTVVLLQDSTGNPLEGGVVTYAGSTWADFGTTDSSGEVSKELLPGNYTFRMNYEGKTVSQQQDIGQNPAVVFNTVAVTVTLINSASNGLPDGYITFAGSTWRYFGTTDSTGSTEKEILPGTYTFRMKYGGYTSQIQQDINTNPSVVFQTCMVTVTLKNSIGMGIQGGTVTCAGSSWAGFGTTDNEGKAEKELLPGAYQFKMRFNDYLEIIARDVSSDPFVHFEISQEYSVEEPEVELPPGSQYLPEDIVIVESTIEVPAEIERYYIPISEAYDITILGEDHVEFEDGYLQIRFTYDPVGLAALGLLEEFNVYYYSESNDTWKPVDRVDVHTDIHEVIACTSHLSTFVLTAIPSGSGGVPDPPASIDDDFPDGIDGSCGAIFMIVDENFTYYQDRDYYIRNVDISPENQITFQALGFEQAMGISTFNGILGNPADLEKHKHYTGDDYIRFTAHMDIDIYVMYDTRGGTDRYDISHDASWLTDEGFNADIVTPGNPTPTRYFVETTDAVQFYTVYRKSYLEGEEVRLHGNRKGSTDNAIDTNYWVIMKRKDVFESEPASMLCSANPDITPPDNVTNLTAVAGAGTVTLQWQNPDDLDFAGVIIRRSQTIPPADVNEGDECTGTVLSPQNYRDESVSAGNTYYYTVFSVDENFNHLEGVSVTAVTSDDTDGDGLTDAYENDDLHIYPFSGGKTDPLNPYTDTDLINDGDEVAAGTDPTNPDDTIPLITQFELTSGTPTGNPFITFDCDASDDVAITGWMVALNNAKPLSSNTAWLGTKPTDYTLPGLADTYTLYLWTKDAAGNVNDEYTPLTIELTIEKPSITEFGLIGANVTNNPEISFTAHGTDDIGITGWMVTDNNTPPSPFDPGWLIDKPENYTLPSVPGDYQLYLWAKDAEDNISDEYPPITITLDINEPAVTDFTLTSSSPTNDQVVTFTIDGTDDTGITGWMITEDNTQPAANLIGWVSTKPISYTLPTIGGNYYLYLWIKDQAGNVSNEYTPVNVILLFNNPVITEFSLTSNPVTTDPLVTFTVDGMDDTGITDWMITEDNTPPLPEDPGWLGTPPDSHTLPSTDGNYNLYIWAKDAAGNVSDEYPPLNITIDTEIPVISDFTLTSSTPTNDINVLFTTAGTDNTGITGWMITENSTQPGPSDPGWLGTKPPNYTLPSATGTYTLYIWAKDEAGNVSILYTGISVDLDVGIPIITDFTLTSSSPTNSPVVTFTLDCTDDTGITAWMITETNTQPPAGDPGWLGIKPIDYTLPSATGAYYLYAWAKDAVGNVSNPYTPINVNLDLGIPQITDFSLTSTSPTGNIVVTFTLDGTDDTGITGWMITLDENQPEYGDPGWLGTKPSDFTLPPPAGIYTLFVWVKDAVGNVSDPYPAFQVELKDPVIYRIPSGSSDYDWCGIFHIVYNDKIYFEGCDETYSGFKMYEYDGTEVKNVSAGTSDYQHHFDLPIVYNNKLCFLGIGQATYELYEFDGLEIRNVPKSSPDYYGGLYNAIIYNGNLYFMAFDTSNTLKMYEYDGSEIRNVNVESSDYFWSFNDPIIFNGNLYFHGYNSSDESRIYEYDGNVITNISFGTSDYYTFHIDPFVYSSNYYFIGRTADLRYQLYECDGSEIKNISPGSSDYLDMGSQYGVTYIMYNGKLYFKGNNGEQNKIYEFDGINVTNVSEGLSDYSDDFMNPFVFNSKLYFEAYRNPDSPCIYEFDGSEIRNINYSSSDLERIFRNQYIYNSKLYFSGSDGSTYVDNSDPVIPVTHYEEKIYEFDGTKISNVSGVSSDYLGNFTEPITYRGKLYFSGLDYRNEEGVAHRKIYQFDGTEIKNVSAVSLDYYSDFISPLLYREELLFVGTDGSGGTLYKLSIPLECDTEKPLITDFILTSSSPTDDPLVTFTLEGTDNVSITEWMIILNSAQPAVDDPGWIGTKPTQYTIPSSTGTYTLYVWAKDPAENISDVYAPITIVLDL